MYWDNMHSGWGWFGGIFMLLFWVALILMIVVLVKWLASGSGSGAGAVRQSNALEILKERYARGEIEQEEFERKRREIE